MKEIEKNLIDGDFLYRQGKQKAKRLLLRAVRKEPNNPILLARLAETYYGAYQNKQALRIIRRSYRLRPDDSLVLWVYATALDFNDRHIQAIKIYRKILNKSLNDIALCPAGKGIRWARGLVCDVRYAIGLCYENLNKRKEAIFWVKRHLAGRGKGVPSIWKIDGVKRKLKNLLAQEETSRIGVIVERLYEKDRWARAQELIKKELKKNPDDIWFLAVLSSIYYEQRKYIKAMEIIKKAIRITPQEPLVMWHYAVALYGLGKKKEAIKVYKKILKKGIRRIAFLDTTEGIRWARTLTNDCRYEIGTCYAHIGNLSLAAKWLRQHLKNRRPGIPSIYSKAEVKKKLKKLLKQKK